MERMRRKRMLAKLANMLPVDLALCTRLVTATRPTPTLVRWALPNLLTRKVGNGLAAQREAADILLASRLHIPMRKLHTKTALVRLSIQTIQNARCDSVVLSLFALNSFL